MAVSEIVEQIERLTVLELNELVKTLETRFGVSAAAAPMASATAPAGAAPAEVVEEQTEFTAVLTAFGEKKIQVIKEVRAITGLGLKEAKDLVDGVPGNLKEGVTKEEAESVKKQIEAAGGTVEIK